MKARVQEDFKKNWVGIVEVKTGDKMAKLTAVESWTDNKTGKVVRKLFDGEIESIKVALSDFPKNAKRLIKPNMEKTIRVRVRLNADGDGVESVTPVSGMFTAKATGLGPKTKDGTHSLYTRYFKKGTPEENSHDEFFCAYQIIDGPFRDAELPAYWLHYKFEGIAEGNDDEGMTQFNTADTPQASQLHKLQEWAQVHGDVLDEPIAWPDDGIILPELEERVLDADRTVNVFIDKGYIKSVQAHEEYGEDESEEVDEDGKPVPDFMKEDDEEVAPVKKLAVKSVAPSKKKVVKKSDDEDDDL